MTGRAAGASVATSLTDIASLDRLAPKRVADSAVKQSQDSARPCQENDAELWFAESASRVEQAKSLCGQCPFQTACLAAALERSEPWGVWGGQIFLDGEIVAAKRGRGRPRKASIAA